MGIRTRKHRLPSAAYVGEVTVAITACEARRQPVFSDPGTVSAFIEELAKSVQAFSCTVPVYCFMPNHLHMIVKGMDPRSRPKAAIERFKHQTGIWLGRNAPKFAWQDDFYDHIIRKNEDLDRQIQYIAGNPVRAGLARSMQDFPFTGSIGSDLDQVLLATL